jgi:hypothetical protein
VTSAPRLQRSNRSGTDVKAFLGKNFWQRTQIFDTHYRPDVSDFGTGLVVKHRGFVFLSNFEKLLIRREIRMQCLPGHSIQQISVIEAFHDAFATLTSFQSLST